jgi:hypothetical protein
MNSLFLIFDKDNKIIGFSRKKEILATDFTIEEVEESTGSKEVSLVSKETTEKTNPSEPKISWKIHRGAFQGGYFDNWTISKESESNLDYRLLLMLPAFKTDKDASLPMTFAL